MPLLRLVVLFAFISPLLRAQQPWRNSPSPATQTFWGIAWSGTAAIGAAPNASPLFVAVGERGTIVTSPDGLAWTARDSGTDRWLLGVTWSPTLRVVVVVGDAGTILTSPDGVVWTPRASGTTQRLNSVTWAPKRFSFPDVFLAVGENGTALTSSDLVTWTPRETGDRGWLRGIANSQLTGPDFFVVTGHDGTILTTQDAGETFQRRASSTVQHLDTAAWLENDLYATGSGFVLTRSTGSGDAWTLVRAANATAADTGFVANALCAFNRALVIVGDNGRIIDEFGRAWATTEPLHAGWRAVAASSSRVVAVGTDGAIASAPLDPAVPREFAIAQSFLDDSVLLHAAPARPKNNVGFSAVQWLLDGQPIAGATNATLALSANEARAGTYTAVATFNTFVNGSLESTTSTASLTLAPRPTAPAPRVIDPAFRPSLPGAPQAVAVLPDGRILVGTNGPAVTRLNANGTRDATWTVPAGTFAGTAIRALVAQSDGRVVVLQQNAGISAATFSLLRLNTDGTPDASFRPDPILAAAGAPPILLADGRWLAINPGAEGVLHRFLADGSRDDAFAAAGLGVPVSASTVSGLFPGPTLVATRDFRDRIYVAVRHGDLASTISARSGGSRLLRLTPTGERDSLFVPVDLEPLQFLRATDAGLVARSLTTSWARLGPTSNTSEIFRLRFDGTRDPAFKPIVAAWARDSVSFANNAIPDGFDVMDATSDGGVIARSVGRRGHFGLVRFAPNGEFDADFSAELGLNSSAISSVTVLPGGNALVGGTFTSLGSTAWPWLLRITPNLFAATTRLANVSVRARTGTGGAALIAGYITSGETSVLARGAGPALRTFNVAGALADPRLGLYFGTTEFSDNDDWGSGPAAFLAATAARLGAFPFSAGSADAALYTTAPAGAYTVQISGKNGASGVALAELYDATAMPRDSRSPRVKNFSVRTATAAGEDTLIVGFMLEGTEPRNVLLRAVGPGLAKFGLADSLLDPVMTLYRGSSAIASNAGWSIDLDARVALQEAFATVGAFPLDFETFFPFGASKDAALLLTLAPGSYTVQVNGRSGAGGTVLVELYEIP